MTTLTYDHDFPLATMAKQAVTSSEVHETTDKPGFFARIMEALGRTYYIETSDGEGYYILPPF